MIVGFIRQSFWLTYIIFLVFIGGLLILFIYISRLMPNKIFLFSKIKILIIKFFYLIIFIFLTNLSFNFSNLEINNWLDKNNFFLYNNTENSYFISNLFNNNEIYLTIAIILYLIIALIITTKIRNSFYGPIRIKF